MPFNNPFEIVDQIAHLLKPVAGQRAYLDPGSGSFLLQLLLATLLGGLFLLKTYWGKVTAFFRHLFHKEESPEDDE